MLAGHMASHVALCPSSIGYESCVARAVGKRAQVVADATVDRDPARDVGLDRLDRIEGHTCSGHQCSARLEHQANSVAEMLAGSVGRALNKSFDIAVCFSLDISHSQATAKVDDREFTKLSNYLGRPCKRRCVAQL